MRQGGKRGGTLNWGESGQDDKNGGVQSLAAMAGREDNAAAPGHGVPLRDVLPDILGHREACTLRDHLTGELG